MYRPTGRPPAQSPSRALEEPRFQSVGRLCIQHAPAIFGPECGQTGPTVSEPGLVHGTGSALVSGRSERALRNSLETYPNEVSALGDQPGFGTLKRIRKCRWRHTNCCTSPNPAMNRNWHAVCYLDSLNASMDKWRNTWQRVLASAAPPPDACLLTRRPKHWRRS